LGRHSGWRLGVGVGVGTRRTVLGDLGALELEVVQCGRLLQQPPPEAVEGVGGVQRRPRLHLRRHHPVVVVPEGTSPLASPPLSFLLVPWGTVRPSLAHLRLLHPALEGLELRGLPPRRLRRLPDPLRERRVQGGPDLAVEWGDGAVVAPVVPVGTHPPLHRQELFEKSLLGGEVEEGRRGAALAHPRHRPLAFGGALRCWGSGGRLLALGGALRFGCGTWLGGGRRGEREPPLGPGVAWGPRRGGRWGLRLGLRDRHQPFVSHCDCKMRPSR